MSHEKLRILAETTLGGFPDLSVERSIEDAVEEWDDLLDDLISIYTLHLGENTSCQFDSKHKALCEGFKDILEKYDGRNK